MLVSRFATAALLALMTLLGVSAASAADYVPPPPPPVMVQPPPQECCSNWYLRGDIGISNQSVGSLHNDNYARYTSVNNNYKDFDSAPFYGLGIGYEFNNWLRFDVTGEYRASANFKGEDIACVATQSPTCQPDVYTGSKSEWTFLANAYIDLGTWNCFTPFVGAGIGMSRNTIVNFMDVNPIPNAVATSTSNSKWSFAWALYAGVGYKVTDNLTVELAYRYLDLGDAATGTMVGFDGTTDTPFQFNHLTSQDIKLGLRFKCCDLTGLASSTPSFAPPPVYAPPPAYAPPPVYQQPSVYQQAPAYQPPPPAYQPPLQSRG